MNKPLEKPMYIRLDARLKLIIDELSERHNSNPSLIVRALCYKSIETILDEKGNLSEIETNNQDADSHE